jgi:uncharacterized linocin/CFP29 family protein
MATAAERIANEMDKEIVSPLRHRLVGRKLFNKVLTYPEGTFNVDRVSIAEMGDATISYQMPDEASDVDNIDPSVTNEKLAVISKRYKIPYAMAQSYLTKGIPLDNAAMLSAVYVAAKKENDLLLQGWTPNGSTYDINGLYQGAGNNYDTSKDFGTFGYATDAVAGAMALILDDGVEGVNFNLTLNPTQFTELVASRSANGVPEMPDILAALNPVAGSPKGEILYSSAMTAATGLISPVDPDGGLIDLVLGLDFQNVPGTDSKMGKLSPYYMTVVAAERPRIKQANSLSKLSAI